MLKSMTLAIALLAAPVAASLTGFDSTAYAQNAAGGGGNSGGNGGGIGGGASEGTKAALFVPDNEYDQKKRPEGRECLTPREGRFGPKRFAGSCGPY